MEIASSALKVAALAGGVGGARLAHGLAQVLPPENLSIIVNVGDDFEHFGLKICPDLDTVCYNLAGLANPDTGWGRHGESWTVLESLRTLDAPDWFALGDQDLATHMERTRRIRAGEPLSTITSLFCRAWGIKTVVLPASDDPIATCVHTQQGPLDFQEYFVRLRCEPKVTGFEFRGIEKAKPAPGVLEAIQEADLVVLCPSNPYVSIDPVLGVPGLRQAVLSRPVLAVSPIIGGQTVKGPAGKMAVEMGITPSALAIALHYGARQAGGLLTGFVMDIVDADLSPAVKALDLKVFVTNTLMKSSSDRRCLAGEILNFASRQDWNLDGYD